MDQAWFDMQEYRRRNLDNAVWIPLRAAQEDNTGTIGYAGFRSDFFGLGSVAIPLDRRADAEGLGWEYVTLMRTHAPLAEPGRYVPSDVFEQESDLGGISLVLEQTGNSDEVHQWHLHQDLVIALKLKREGNVWVAIDEGYAEVARLRELQNGKPKRLEILAGHLKDYLCARGMALYVSWIRNRWEVLENSPAIEWDGNPFRQELPDGKWVGSIEQIHEGGAPYGSTGVVFHVGRENIDYGEDVPEIGTSDDNVVWQSRTIQSRGSKLYRVSGELCRTEWVNPAVISIRVRGDEDTSSPNFVIDAEGNRESGATLQESRRWLWFRPQVITDLVHCRGGGLRWSTRDTGSVRCSPNFDVDFGVNELGLVNTYAKDVVLAPAWQQRIWAGRSIGPDGGVCRELREAQDAGIWGTTVAPESALGKIIERLNQIGNAKFGFPLFREHPQVASLLERTHRFRAVDNDGLLALAKDVARLTADSIDAKALKRIAHPPEENNWGSLKIFEYVVSKSCDESKAHVLFGPLHGAYNLRHGDAHLVGKEIEKAFELASVDRSLPFVWQGFQLIESCANALHQIADVLDRADELHPGD